MTRNEIEKQVREQMQQTITDKEALWAKIESRLPEQQPVEQPAPKLHRSVFRRVMGVAACFLFVAAGASIFTRQHQRMENATNKSLMAAPAADEAPKQQADGSNADLSIAANPADEEGDAEEYNGGNAEQEAEMPAANQTQGSAAPKAEDNASELLTYEALDLSKEHSIADSVDRSLLQADSEYFSLAQVLMQTECFADVEVLDGQQDAQTGRITYTLQVLGTYGGEELPEELTLSTGSPYLMERSHRYVLPLCRDADGWKLADDSAPQMERTLDDKVLLHNGWYLFTGEQAVPVHCKPGGAEDCRYDRMCLADAEILNSFLDNWENGSFE